MRKLASVDLSDRPTFLTIVGFSAVHTLCVEALTAAIKKLDPSRIYKTSIVPQGSGSTETALLVDVEDLQFTIVSRETMKPGEFASAAAASALTWGDAASSLSAAVGDVVIAANRPAADHAAAVKTAFLLTAVTEAVLATSPAVFVYWGTADLLVEPKAFSKAAKAMLAENQPPVLQWVRFDLFRGDDMSGQPTGGMHSRGLASFVGHELQFDPVAMTPVEIARRAVGYAEQLIRDGASDVAEIDGPATGERIRLTVHDTAAGVVLRMQSAASAATAARVGQN